MASFLGGDDADRPLSEINVTPLVDVMLVLLVIFIVAAPLMAQALRVDLPKAEATAGNEPEVLTVIVHRDGIAEFEGHHLDQPALSAALADRSRGRPDLVLRIGGDGAAPYQAVADVLAAARLAGLNRIAFATQRP